MPRRSLDSCLLLMQFFQRNGTKTVTTPALLDAIEQLIGADPRIRTKYLDLMRRWKFIEPAVSKEGEWLLNFEKAYELSI